MGSYWRRQASLLAPCLYRQNVATNVAGFRPDRYQLTGPISFPDLHAKKPLVQHCQPTLRSANLEAVACVSLLIRRLVTAIAILSLSVLPSEYAIDPTPHCRNARLTGKWVRSRRSWQKKAAIDARWMAPLRVRPCKPGRSSGHRSKFCHGSAAPIPMPQG